jgi:hypothetical protein
MVAAQAYIDQATMHRVQMHHAQLRVVPPSQRYDIVEELPGDARVVFDSLIKAIDDLVFRPVVEAPNVEAATKLALSGFERFTDLWLAAISVLLPWLQDRPEQARRLAGTTRGTWRSERACSVLGDDACDWFSAAQSARLALMRAMPIDEAGLPGDQVEAILRYTLLADFALTLGTFLINSDAKLVDGLSLMVGKLAHESATNAFALATQGAYADPTPTP